MHFAFSSVLSEMVRRTNSAVRSRSDVPFSSGAVRTQALAWSPATPEHDFRVEDEDAVRKIIADFEVQSESSLTSCQVLLSSITHRRNVDHRQFLSSIEGLVARVSEESDRHLESCIDRAIHAELHACFLANCVPSRYCVL